MLWQLGQGMVEGLGQDAQRGDEGGGGGGPLGVGAMDEG